MARIFYSMAGEGRGHATRVRVVVESLRNRHDIVLFAPGQPEVPCRRLPHFARRPVPHYPFRMPAPWVAVYVVPHPPAAFAKRLAAVERAIAQAARGGARLVCFPEYIGQQRVKETIAAKRRPFVATAEDYPDGPVTRLVRAACARNRIGALYGISGRMRGKVYNLTVSVSSRGKILGAYAKTHLAHTEQDQDRMAAGARIHLLPTEIGPAGVVTCWEIMYPEVARTCRALGARFFFDGSAGNSENFHVLARARAIENYTFFIFSSYALPKGRKGCAAAFVAPDGKVLKKATHRPGLLFQRVDLAPLKQSPYWNRTRPKVDIRRHTWARRRPELYRL